MSFSMRQFVKLLPLFPCVIASVCAPVYATESGSPLNYQLIEKTTLEGPVRWDYVSVDSANHHLFLTRGEQVDVFDTRTKMVIGTIANTPGVHGVAIANDQDRGFTSNGKNDKVTIFSLSTLAQIGTVAVGQQPDAIVYDPASHRVFAANAKGKSLSVIDAATGKLVATIGLPGSPETAVVNGKGKLFVALEDKNAIATIDTAALKLVHTADVSSVCDEPAGLAIDPASDRLFAGCHNQKMAIVDGKTGKILGSAPIGKGNDAVAYDVERRLAFASNGEGNLTVVAGDAPFRVNATVPTMRGARTMTLDPATHQLYLVSAEYGPADPASKQRPPTVPGTFTVLTVVAP